MDASCTPAIVTSALFFSLIILDVFRRETNLIIGHALFGIITGGLMIVLCTNGMGPVAWGLLLIPAVSLVLGWIIMMGRRKSYHPPGVLPANSSMLGPGGTPPEYF
jgi:lipopolysaccharide export LptBFGC system permease protein LptF